jgi:hypothetical protein
MRALFNEGQEVTRQDLNKIQIAKEREFYDRVIHEMVQRGTDSFFEESFVVSRVDANTISIAAGLGFQEDTSQDSPEPIQRPIYLADALELDITAAHGSLDRIDIVCVKAERATTLQESRRYKATVESLPTTQTFDVETDWEADCQIVAGTPDASPVAPSTPSGYIRIASILVTAVTGIASSGDITDERDLLPFAQTLQIDTSAFKTVPTKAADTPLITTLAEMDTILGVAFASYQAIVGSETYCTHSTLSSAITAVSAGARILIISSLNLSASVTINKNNLSIEGTPGVTLIDDGATTGLIIDADGVRIQSLRFADFTTAIEINDGSQNNFITNNRFSSCTTDIDDQNTTPNNVHMNNIEE